MVIYDPTTFLKIFYYYKAQNNFCIFEIKFLPEQLDNDDDSSRVGIWN